MPSYVISCAQRDSRRGDETKKLRFEVRHGEASMDVIFRVSREATYNAARSFDDTDPKVLEFLQQARAWAARELEMKVRTGGLLFDPDATGAV